MGDQGFDDQFNEGIFQASLHNTSRLRPHMWPKSTSEMRRYTSYDWQGLPGDHETAFCDYKMHRPHEGWRWIDGGSRP
jgi:hypothetical protein